EIVYDDELGKATGVKVIDTESHEELFFQADIIFSCASAIASTSILMQSKSERFPNGLGNDSGELGHNIMDHHFKVGAYAETDLFDDTYVKGRKPNGFYIPRFRNLDEKTEQKDYIRGFGYQGGAQRANWSRAVGEMSYGADLKKELVKPGKWQVGMTAFGECLPYHDNKITLDYENLDEWGLPQVNFDVSFKENENKMRRDMRDSAVEMLKAAGFERILPYDNECFPGNGIHEMGGARMGRDPKTSVLNENNQIHACTNVYVTDGACMTSAGCQNPSLTYMALTARAANHAAKTFKLQEAKTS
ncbi:MAG: GMC oxidoreductase, partial [Flavobacteriaceae bacterium]